MSFKKQIGFIIIVLLMSNIIPTCAEYKPEISRSFAMSYDITLPHIVSFSPQAASNKERIFVDVRGLGFEKRSRLIINGFVVGEKYIRVTNPRSLIVRVPKGVPEGKYSVVIKNPDGRTSNEVWFEVRS